MYRSTNLLKQGRYDLISLAVVFLKILAFNVFINLSRIIVIVIFSALKAEVEKLEINKLVNVPTSLNHLKTKVDDLDVDKLKTIYADLKKINDEADNEVAKNQNSTH